ncbi:DUF421 domain-containing protein [Domibacillus epiphyticus]|uniref:DUF421 domain-containing protein n=1 Tax=Domibacillus epiphyticus TaxID=1714355 RepID=UPI001E64B716|nr:DUF421 domain-containing protein [Domibacillus epiphyticus]
MGIGLLTLKVIIGFAALFFLILATGKVSINQLSPYHLVFVLVLGDFLGESLYENKIKIFHFLYAAGLWTLLMLAIEYLTQKKKSARSLLEGNPSIIIRDGVLDREMMNKNKLDINEVASLLRLNSVFSVREVQYGILEENGQISVLLKSKYDQTVKEDLNIPESEVDLPISFIIDGEILLDNLQERGFDHEWLLNELKANGYNNEKEVFFADWREGEGIHISPK